MKTPAFWLAGKGGLAVSLLSPLSWAYRAGAAIKKSTGPVPWRTSAPVICVGNVTAGGAGKTPIALDIAGRIRALGFNPHLLTRGYGGKFSGPLRVEPETHTASDVGDEALLLARRQPTWVGSDRAATAIMALEAGASVLVMDDGFQNFSLAKDLSLLVFDGGFGIGNGRLLPAGPLREPLKNALARAQGVVSIGADNTDALAGFSPLIPRLTAHLRPVLKGQEMKGRRVLPFAGIGRPKKFFDTLRDYGADIAETIAFADHHPYSPSEMTQLRSRADELNAGLITTEKDAVRLSPTDLKNIEILTITVEWEDESTLEALLASTLNENTHAG